MFDRIQQPEKLSTISPLSLQPSEWVDLEAKAEKALQWAPTQRYGSVDALLRDLEHLERNEPLDAHPRKAIYSLRKLIRRRRWPMLAGTAAIALMGGMAIYFTWKLARARDKAILQTQREHAIQEFMTSLFEGGDVTNGPSKDLKVVDILAAGAARVKQFDRDPLLQRDL